VAKDSYFHVNKVRNFEFEVQPTDFLPAELNSRKYNNIIIFNDIESEIHVMIFYIKTFLLN
jgi:hypothetical protein